MTLFIPNFEGQVRCDILMSATAASLVVILDYESAAIGEIVASCHIYWFSNCSFACMSSKYADCADVPCCIHAPHRQLEVSENMVLEFCDILRIYLIALQQCTEVEKKWYISSTCSSYLLAGLQQCSPSKSTQQDERNDRLHQGFQRHFEWIATT